jgi:hypothetical protein
MVPRDEVDVKTIDINNEKSLLRNINPHYRVNFTS